MPTRFFVAGFVEPKPKDSNPQVEPKLKDSTPQGPPPRLLSSTVTNHRPPYPNHEIPLLKVLGVLRDWIARNPIFPSFQEGSKRGLGRCPKVLSPRALKQTGPALRSGPCCSFIPGSFRLPAPQRGWCRPGSQCPFRPLRAYRSDPRRSETGRRSCALPGWIRSS